MRGILADHNVRGQADYLLMLIRTDRWVEFWEDLGLVLLHFEDVNLPPTASHLEVWQRCQAEDLVVFHTSIDTWNLPIPRSGPSFLLRPSSRDRAS